MRLNKKFVPKYLIEKDRWEGTEYLEMNNAIGLIMTLCAICFAVWLIWLGFHSGAINSAKRERHCDIVALGKPHFVVNHDYHDYCKVGPDWKEIQL